VDIVRRYFLAVVIASILIIISSSFSIAFAQNQMECFSYQGPGDMNLRCKDIVDLRTSTIDFMNQNVEGFLKLFGDEVIVSDIRNEGSATFAKVDIKIPIPFLPDKHILTEIKYSIQGKNYVVDYIQRDLKGSKLTVSLEKTLGYDGTENGGSIVHFDFMGKNLPWGAKEKHMIFAFDRGLDTLEQTGKIIQQKLDAQKKLEESTQSTETVEPQTEQKPEEPATETTETVEPQTEQKPESQEKFRGPPIVDSDGDGISDEFDMCEFDKETYNGYLDLDGCPDKIPQPVKQKPIIQDWDKDGISDKEDLCRTQAEVYNDYIDWDGCPDTAEGQILVTLDDDNDGILNHLDQCPNMPEVYNGFKDNDGCPDAILGNPKNLKLIQNDDSSKLPYWVKNNAKWWSEGSISNSDFLEGIKYMIKEDIVKISDVSPKSGSATADDIPYWIKKNAGWWADGLINEDEFIRNIQYLISNKIIEVY